MKRFAQLFIELDQTTKTNEKVGALVKYFKQANDQDKLWTIALFSHRRPKRTVNTSLLRTWAAEYAQIPEWLFNESYDMVGDLAETIALVIPEENISNEDTSLSLWIEAIMALKDANDSDKKTFVLNAWGQLDRTERFLFNKLITGGFRIGVSQKLTAKALAQVVELDQSAVAHRLMGNWSPQTHEFSELFYSDEVLDDISKPYPFYLAYALEQTITDLGEEGSWFAELKWDGIRGQLIFRDQQIFIWTRGEELVTDKYPELSVLAHFLEEAAVIDGEIMPYKDGRPLSFYQLQKRIGRKTLSKKILAEIPIVFRSYDLLELGRQDLRAQPLSKRRADLENLVAQVNHPHLQISPLVPFENWSDLESIREQAREKYSEGLMLKRKDSTYRSGRKKGDWWKWKIDPLTIDAVMIYAQRGHGRRASLYTDFTFAVWNGEQLIPFTKAYSGLTDQEFQQINRFIRSNTLERYGPVRVVKPELVFEIAFEGINKSTRHKSGIALRFPRMKRWRQDKPKEEANSLADLQALLDLYGDQ